jgi:prepilin-type N-terminal cleavage/methylation domain-containing protein
VKRRARRRQSGFSLIETITALAIFALLSGLLTSALWGAQKIDDSLSRDKPPQVSLMRASAIFSSYIEAVTPPAIRRTRAPSAIFEGNSRTIAFNASLEANSDRAGIFAITMQIERTPDRTGTRLVVTRQRVGLDGQPFSTADASVLLDDGEELQFAFVDERKEGAAGIGYSSRLKVFSTWPNTARLPKRVMLLRKSIMIAEARPKLQMDPRCIALETMQRIGATECQFQ